MKIYLLLLILSISNIGYARINKQITMMYPEDRYNLFISMKEVADAYKDNKRTTKADSFYRSALEVYPIGDEAHQLANQLGITLDDEQTFSDFMLMGEEAYEAKDYKKSLVNYLMVNELDVNTDLYQKISEVYSALGDMDNASYYQDLSQGMITSDDSMLLVEDEVLNSYEVLNVEEFNTMVEDDYNSQRN